MDKDEFYIWMEEVYGLETILEQNDIEAWEVIKLLEQQCLIDIGDYFATTLTDLENDE